MARSRKKLIRRLVFFSLVFGTAAAMALFGYLWWQEEKSSTYPLQRIWNWNSFQLFHSWYWCEPLPAINRLAIGERNECTGARLSLYSSKQQKGFQPWFFVWQETGVKQKMQDYRGAYHFFIPSKDGILQARQFIGVVDLEPETCRLYWILNKQTALLKIVATKSEIGWLQWKQHLGWSRLYIPILIFTKSI